MRWLILMLITSISTLHALENAQNRSDIQKIIENCKKATDKNPIICTQAARILLNCIKESEKPEHSDFKGFVAQLLNTFSFMVNKLAPRDEENACDLANEFFESYTFDTDIISVPVLKTFFELGKTYQHVCPAYEKTLNSWIQLNKRYKHVTCLIFSDAAFTQHAADTPFAPTEILKQLSNLHGNMSPHFSAKHLALLACSTLARCDDIKPAYTDALCTYAHHYPEGVWLLAPALISGDPIITESCETVMISALADNRLDYSARLRIANALTEYNADEHALTFESIISEKYEQATDVPAKLSVIAGMLEVDSDFGKHCKHRAIEHVLRLCNLSHTQATPLLANHPQDKPLAPIIMNIFEEATLHQADNTHNMWHLARALLNATFGDITHAHQLKLLVWIMNNPSLSLKQSFWAYAGYHDRTGLWDVSLHKNAPCKKAISLLNTLTNTSSPVAERNKSLKQLIDDGFPRTLIKRKLSNPALLKSEEERVLLKQFELLQINATHQAHAA